MNAQLLRIGMSQSPIVVLDDFSGGADAVIDMAAKLAPFAPAKNTNYPGVRRVLTHADGAAYGYVQRLMSTVAPYVGGAFDIDQFELIEASFSIVTTPRALLSPEQRAPHFDSLTPGHLALVHYLSDTPESGTAFYRQRATDVETVNANNVEAFIAAARRDSADIAEQPGYIHGSNAYYEQIGAVDSVRDRLIIYPACLLHSGIIPHALCLSDDPRRGRLTANFFVQG